jgi:hypothetical protein
MNDVRFLIVVVDVEVLGLEDLEVELFPLDLVSTEVLSLGEGSEEGAQQSKDYESNCESHRHLDLSMNTVVALGCKFAAPVSGAQVGELVIFCGRSCPDSWAMLGVHFRSSLNA